MYIGSDVLLRGDIWNDTLEKLKPIIETNYGVYVLSVAIGIRADKQIDLHEATLTSEQYKSIPRSILHNNVHVLDLLFKSAIITTKNINKSEEDRMELAFNDDSKSDDNKNFNRMGFLTKFANYGVNQLAERIGSDPLENIEKLNELVIECSEGLSLDDFSFNDLDVSDSDIAEETV